MEEESAAARRVAIAFLKQSCRMVSVRHGRRLAESVPLYALSMLNIDPLRCIAPPSSEVAFAFSRAPNNFT